MSARTPLSLDEIRDIITSALWSCEPEVRNVFAEHQIDPVRLPFAKPTTLDTAFVVAKRRDQVIYYEEIEEGFNTSHLDFQGRIAEHWLGQDSLCVALREWFSNAHGQQRRSAESPVQPVCCVDGVGADIDGETSERSTLPFVLVHAQLDSGNAWFCSTCFDAGRLAELQLSDREKQTLDWSFGSVFAELPGREQEAVRILTSCVAEHRVPDCLSPFGRALARLGKLHLALAILENLRDDFPDHPFVKRDALYIRWIKLKLRRESAPTAC